MSCVTLFLLLLLKNTVQLFKYFLLLSLSSLTKYCSVHKDISRTLIRQVCWSHSPTNLASLFSVYMTQCVATSWFHSHCVMAFHPMWGIKGAEFGELNHGNASTVSTDIFEVHPTIQQMVEGIWSLLDPPAALYEEQLTVWQSWNLARLKSYSVCLALIN